MKPKRTNREVYPQALRLACAKEAVASQVGPGGFFCVQGFSRVLGFSCLVVFSLSRCGFSLVAEPGSRWGFVFLCFLVLCAV